MNIIRQVEIEGYRSYGAKQTIDLSKPGLVLLTGDNRDRGVSSAAGKSTLFKAITTCLFEENDDNSIKGHGVNVLRKDLGTFIGTQFTDERGLCYYVVYAYNHKQYGSDWYIYRWNTADSKWEDLREEKKADTRAVIESILKMNYSQFLNRAYMAQETVAEFIWRTQKERIEIFSGILNLQEVDTWVQAARDWRREIEKTLLGEQGKVALLSKQIEEARKALRPEAEMMVIRADLTRIEDDIVEVSAAIDQKRADADRITSLIEIKANHKTYEELTKASKQKLDAIGRLPDGDVIGQKYTDAESQVDDLRARHKEADVHLKAQQRRVLEITSLGNTCGACEQPIDEPTRAKLLEMANYTLHGFEIKEQALRAAKKSADEAYEAAKAEYDHFHDRQCDFHRYEAEYRKNRDKLASYETQIADMRRFLGDGVDYPDRLNADYQLLTERHIALNREHTEAQTALHAALEAQDHYQGLLRSREEAEEAIQRCEEQIAYGKRIEVLLGDKGFRSYKVKASRTQFNNSLNRYLSILTDGDVEAELVTEVLKADGKGMKAELDILVSDGEKRGVPIRQYSGGEKGTLSLAILGSFWDLSSQQATGGVNVLLLDEPFANMDSWQVEKTCKLLESMRDSGRTILVVTNQPSVRDRGVFDREIRAVKENHITHLEEHDLSSDH